MSPCTVTPRMEPICTRPDAVFSSRIRSGRLSLKRGSATMRSVVASAQNTLGALVSSFCKMLLVPRDDLPDAPLHRRVEVNAVRIGEADERVHDVADLFLKFLRVFFRLLLFRPIHMVHETGELATLFKEPHRDGKRAPVLPPFLLEPIVHLLLVFVHIFASSALVYHSNARLRDCDETPTRSLLFNTEC